MAWLDGSALDTVGWRLRSDEKREGRGPGIGRRRGGFEGGRKGRGLRWGSFRDLQNRAPMPMVRKLVEDERLRSSGVSGFR
jgi:hypothetical protein